MSGVFDGDLTVDQYGGAITWGILMRIIVSLPIPEVRRVKDGYVGAVTYLEQPACRVFP